MKHTTLYYLMLVPAAVSAATAQASDTAIEKLITKNGLKNSKVMSMYKSGQLVVTVKTPHKIILTNRKNISVDADAQTAMYWYRAMSTKEYILFDKTAFTHIPCAQSDKHFCGIAPSYSYVAKYLSNAKPGIVVAFGTAEPGWLLKDFTGQHQCQIKAEGGGTYGLGPTGTSASCDLMYRKQGLGKVFNQWLGPDKKIDVTISSVLLTIK
ncbi:hypothetical protein [Aquitalea denitrificans]|uniref:hypothetical protein n=1 Tax=Aquitalea denitrificans TaxID=519081 RepID=UPI00135C9CFB|nr:hypothetical protein [Aquitalea denitrificans]